jgi:glycosyltransferase involved in cell wall biosynthesis
MLPSVSILCHTLAGNAFGRALLLAELLSRDFSAHIVCACHPSDELWLPARGSCSFEIRRWNPWSYPGFLARASSIARALVTGDIIYAVKPHLSSLGLGLTARKLLGRPLIADVDDWELGFSSLGWEVLTAPWAALSAASPLHTRRFSARVRSADAVTVSNTFLFERYGGSWLPHARDERRFDETPSGTPSSEPIVLFAGTPRRHKGLGDLVVAFRKLQTSAQLRIVGGTLDPQLVRDSQGDPRIRVEPPVPLSTLYGILAAADVVVIPQADTPASRGQLPAKLLDAMAMGKAIISTHVGDIPRWLSGDAGQVVPAGDPEALTGALSALLADPEQRAALGRRARARFLALGSYAVVRPRLVSLLQNVLAARPLGPLSAPFSEPLAAPQVPDRFPA